MTCIWHDPQSHAMTLPWLCNEYKYIYIHILLHVYIYRVTTRQKNVGCLKLQVIFRKKATNYRALLRKMTYEDKASYGSLSPFTYIYIYRVTTHWIKTWLSHDFVMKIYIYTYYYIYTYTCVVTLTWPWRDFGMNISIYIYVYIYIYRVYMYTESRHIE